MRKIITGIGLLAVLPILASEKEARPNIIIFLVDDMGVMDSSLPFLTSKDGKPEKFPLNNWYNTPNMETLAENGIRFSTFYTHSVSSPTRASLMTGQNSARHGTTNWINPENKNTTTNGPTEWNWKGISKDDVTLPKLLREDGYKTIHVGKAHFGPIGSDGEFPQNIGFDVNIGGSSIGQPGSYYGESGYGNIKGNKARAVQGLEEFHGKNVFLTDALTIKANREIDKAVEEGKPFFLYMAHYAAHAPFEADKRFLHNYTDPERNDRAKAFATLIEGMDKSLGDIMEHLKEIGVAENTMIIFLGDNGTDALLGELHGVTSSAPLRGKKGTFWEGGMRVPFIASWVEPSNNSIQKEWDIPKGAIQQQMGTINDVFPTVLSLAGVDSPRGHIVDGVDLKKQLLGKRNKKSRETFLMHFPHQHNNSHFTVYINGEWKLIYEYRMNSPKNPRPMLFNLSMDPQENMNFAPIERIILEEMINKMKNRLEDQGALYPIDKDGNQIKPFMRYTN